MTDTRLIVICRQQFESLKNVLISFELIFFKTSCY